MNQAQLFPLFAAGISVAAYFFPGVFTPMGGLVVPGLCVIMLGMGATLSPGDFAAVARKPRAVGVGMALQFGLMPLLAFAIGHALRLDATQITGMVLVGAVSGGTASNVMSGIAGGDVALSITMTACSTIAGVVMTPLLTRLYLGQSVPVPVGAMFLSILEIVAVPVALGLAINRLMRKREKVLKAVCPIVSTVGILLVIAVIIAENREYIRTAGPLVAAAVMLHNVSGLLAGYWAAKLLGCDKRTAVTIAIETGMQNSGLAVALARQCFTAGAALPGALFSVWHNLSGSVFAAWAAKGLRGSRPA